MPARKGEKVKKEPVAFSQAVADSICERIAQGEPLKPICRDAGMPSFSTVYGWIRARPEFAAAMEQARQLGAHAISDEQLEIADDGRNDWMLSNDKDNPGYKLNGEHVQRSKLRIWARQQLAAKWHPKAYGDRTVIAGDPDAPLHVKRSASDFSDDELAAIAARAHAAKP